MLSTSARLRPFYGALAIFMAPASVQGSTPAGLAPTEPSGPVWDAERKARGLIVDALVAHGVGTGATIRSLRVEQVGERTLYNQSPAWDRPPVRQLQRSTIVYDALKKRLAEDRESRAPGGFRLTTQRAIDPNGGFRIDPQRRNTGDFWQKARPSDWTGSEQSLIRTMPPLLLQRAVDRPASLRYRGRTEEGGATVDLIDYAERDGTLITLRLDTNSHLLTGIDTLSDEPISGDRVASARFEDYSSLAGLQLPRRRIELTNARVILDQRMNWQINPQLSNHLFEVPSGYRDPADNLPDPDNLKLGDGVWLLQNLPGDNRVLLAEFADHVGIVETPAPSAVVASVMERIASLTPGKPLKWVAFTHHHSDHGGGVGAFAAGGATVVVPRADAGFVRHAASAPHTLLPGAPSDEAAPPQLRTFSNRITLSDPINAIELIQVGPNSHADSMIVAWLPRQRILFQGDLLNLPDGGSPAPAIQLTVEGLRAIKRLGLKPLKIAGVHGEVGTMADWEAEVEARQRR